MRKDEGFIAVDALVALTVLSSTLAGALTAFSVGRSAARAAAELEQADQTLRFEMEQTAGHLGTWADKTQDVSWRVRATALTPDDKALTIPCARSADAKSLRSARNYRLQTMDICVQDRRS